MYKTKAQNKKEEGQNLFKVKCAAKVGKVKEKL